MSAVRETIPTEMQARRTEVAGMLAASLAPESVLVDREALKPYECDGLSAYRETPLVAAIPANEAEVAVVMRVARDTGTPVVPRGSGTGLSGGALPLRDGILLSMAKFNRIVEVDVLARTARVQPGVTNLRISQHVAPYGLYYAPDPSSQIACSIGGNVAENSGGVHCLKYGLTLHNVLKVRGFTVAGEPVEFGSEALDAPGLYDEFLMYLARWGHAVPAQHLQRDWSRPHVRDEALLPVFEAIYEDTGRYWREYGLCEDLVDLETQFQLWRFRHMRTVMRIIGFKRGTGGSSGVGFLRQALDLTFFPELFDVRTSIGPGR